jgi:epoxyqueuosine reductase
MEDLIKGTVERLVMGHPGNWSETLAERYYEAPLVQFASADDPLFEAYKQIVGSWHRTPREAFEETYGVGSWRGGTVISWVVPCSEGLRDSNRHRKERPSREWALAYNFASKTMQREVRAGLLELLLEKGHRGVAPADATWFGMVDTPSGKSSTWSERHAAYAAGLGTFSLNRGFISEKGIAVALNSVITEAILTPTPRRAKSHLDNCLFFAGKACGACMRRCPAGAITKDGHDKNACLSYAYGAESVRLAAGYGVQGPAGCALCQIGVPCERANPTLGVR